MRHGTLAFAGEAPKIDARLLQDSQATIARDCDLVSGELRPLGKNVFIERHGVEGAETLFFHRGELFAFEKKTSIVRTPTDDTSERFFLFGGGLPPRHADLDELRRGDFLELGVPEPSRAPQLVTRSGDGEGLDITTFYASTYVNKYGEEGRPSNVSTEVTYKRGETLLVVVTDEDSENEVERYGIVATRLYRVFQGEFSFVGEQPIGETTYEDDTSIDPNEVLDSEERFLPPEFATELHVLATGVGLAWTPGGRTVYVSEAFNLSYWPSSFTVEYPLVTVSSYGSTAVMLTTGYPEIATVVDPRGIVPIRLNERLPCVSDRGVVQGMGGVIFPTPSSLHFIGVSGDQSLTQTTHDDADWAALVPSSFVAAFADGRYTALTAVEGFVYDTRESTARIIRTSDKGTAVLNIPGTDRLMVSQGVDAFELYASAEPRNYRWRSKLYGGGSPMRLTSHRAVSDALVTRASPEDIEQERDDVFGTRQARIESGEKSGGELAGSVLGRVPLGGSLLFSRTNLVLGATSATLRVYADGELIHEHPLVSADAERLEFTPPARLWQFEIEGSIPVSEEFMAGSLSELFTGD